MTRAFVPTASAPDDHRFELWSSHSCLVRCSGEAATRRNRHSRGTGCVKTPTSEHERPIRHSRESGNPGVLEGSLRGVSPLHPAWIPAFAGMTISGDRCLSRMGFSLGSRPCPCPYPSMYVGGGEISSLRGHVVTCLDASHCSDLRRLEHQLRHHHLPGVTSQHGVVLGV